MLLALLLRVKWEDWHSSHIWPWIRSSPNWTTTATSSLRNSSGMSRRGHEDKRRIKDSKRSKGFYATFQEPEMHFISIFWANYSPSHCIVWKTIWLSAVMSRLARTQGYFSFFFLLHSINIIICHTSGTLKQEAPKIKRTRNFFLFIFSQ